MNQSCAIGLTGISQRTINNNKIMNKLSKAQAISKFGEDIVSKAMASNAEPTSRVMYPAFENTEHIGKAEYAGAPVTMDGCRLTAYWYLSPEEECDTDSFDWDGNVEFEAEEIW